MTDIKSVARAIDAVKTAGAAKILVGMTLKDISEGYRAVAKIADRGVREGSRRELDSARANLEAYYRYLAQIADKTAIQTRFRERGKPLILKAYVVMAGGSGAAAYVPPSGPAVLKSLLVDETVNRARDVADSVATAGRIPWQFIAAAAAALYYLGGRSRR